MSVAHPPIDARAAQPMLPDCGPCRPPVGFRDHRGTRRAAAVRIHRAVWGRRTNPGPAVPVRHDKVAVRVITPGSSAGEPPHVLSSLERWSPLWDSDPVLQLVVDLFDRAEWSARPGAVSNCRRPTLNLNSDPSRIVIAPAPPCRSVGRSHASCCFSAKPQAQPEGSDLEPAHPSPLAFFRSTTEKERRLISSVATGSRAACRSDQP
jgi:hypothetical protein